MKRSTSIIIRRENSIGRLNVFDEGELPMHKINAMADAWRDMYGHSVKIEVVETEDNKCVPNFRPPE